MPETTKTTAAWYSLKLGERFAPDNNTSITRVPGGWVYGDMQGTCFIPFHNEFQPKEEIPDDLPF
jgi:hypothetical protein